MHVRSIVFIGMLAHTPLLQAEDSYHYVIENEWIAVDQASFAPLVYGEKMGRPVQELRAEMRKLVELKKASMVKRVNYISAVGESSGVEDVTQLIYATEYEPMQHKPEKRTAEGKVLEPARHTLPKPSTFEQRPVGTIVRSEAAQAGKHFFTIKLKAEQVRKHPDKIFSTYTFEGQNYSIQWPKTSTSKAFTSLRVAVNEPVLVAMHVPYSSEGKRLENQRVIHFLNLNKVVSP